MSFLTEGVAQWLIGVLQGMVEQVARWVPTITTPRPYWNEDWAQSSHEVIVTVAWTLLTVRIIAECYRLYILRDAGESIVPPGVLFRRTIIAAVAIPATAWFVPFMANLSYWLARAVASEGAEVNVSAILLALVESGMNPAVGLGAVLIIAAVLLILALAFLLLFVQAAIRGVELAVAFVLGPGLAVSAAGADDFLAVGTLGIWFREVCVLALTQVIQTLLMVAIIYYTLGSAFEILSVLTSIAFMWVAIKAPSILRQYAYHTGMGQAATYGTMGLAVRTLSKLPW